MLVRLALLLSLAVTLRAQVTALSGTYVGQAITGDITVGVPPAGPTTATFQGGTTFTGANATFGASSGIYWQQTGTLAGKVLTMGTGSYWYLYSVGSTLVIDAASTATGDISIYSDGSASTSFTNQGVLTHNNTSNSGQIYAALFTNQGSISATAGTLYLNFPSAGYNAVNAATGTVTADGSGTTVYIRGNFDNDGTITAQNSGMLHFDGTNTTANLGNVILATGGRARLNGTIDNTAATLTAPTGGSYELYAGTISGGTVASGALTFTSSGGYLSGATLAGDLVIPTSTYMRFSNGGTFTGTNATLANSAGIYWEQVGTLTGKALTMGTGSYLYLSGASRSLTLDATTTVTGDVSIYTDGSAGSTITNLGILNYTDATTSGQIYASTFTNQGSITATAGTLYLNFPSATYSAINTATGTVTADGSSTTVYIRGNFDNNGTLTAQNSGILLFDGTNTSANLGNVVLATGGRARLNGTIDNSAATLTAPTGGSYELYGGTISGGTIASGALTFTGWGGYLSGATLTGDLALPTNAYMRFSNGGTFTGASATLANNSGIYWEQVGSLTGKSLTLNPGSYIYLSGAGRSLTIDATTTVTGDVSIYTDGSAGSTITNLGILNYTDASTSGQIFASTFTNQGTITATAGTLYLNWPSAGYNAVNTATGTVTADGASTTVYLRGNFDNNGTLTAQNSGTLLFDGNTTTANLGNVVLATGGRARLNGTIDNTAATLTAPTGGSYELLGGTISGGTVASGALSFTTSGGYLSGATLTGDLALPTNAYVILSNGGTFTGANATFANSSGIYWQQADTLAGKSITMNPGSYIYLSGASRSLTLDATTTVTGDVSIYSDGSAGSTITNLGTLNYTDASTTGQIYASMFTNQGAIMATAGTLYLNWPSASYNAVNAATGTVTADGASTTVYLRGNFDNNGTVTAQNSGLLYYDGSTTTANLGNVVLATGGRALLAGTIDNSATTLAAPTGGSYELYSGTISGGTIASGALTFTNWGGYLSGATLTGDLVLPTNTYMRFSNGGTFTGANATLANGSGVYWEQAGNLAGKAITMNPGSYIYLSGGGRSLTLDATTTVTGDVSIYSDGSAGSTITNLGNLTYTDASTTGQIYASTFTNQGSITTTAGTLYLSYPSAGYNGINSPTGTITADGASATVYLRGNFDNNGTVTAQNGGTLYFDGTNTPANLGNVVLASGGRARLAGTLNNAAATLVSPTGGPFELYGGTIQGGTVAAGALTYSNGFLDGVSLAGDLVMPASSYVYFDNGTTFTGANATFGAGSGIYWRQAGTLTGKSVTMGNGSYLYLSGAGRSLTIDSTSNFTGTVSVYSDGSAGSTIMNQGTLTHTSGGGNLYARTFTNAGTIAVTGGSVSVGTTSTGYEFTNEPGATLRITGGSLNLYSPLDNLFVNQGLLAVEGGILYPYYPLINGTTGTISGAGTIHGDVTLQGGVLAPGNSIGTLTVSSSDFTVASASTLQIEVSGVSADRLTFQNPTSNVALGAGLLDLSLVLLSAPVEGTTYTIANIASGANTFTGYFQGLPSTGSMKTSSFSGTDYLFQVTYLANSISITSVPEPSTYALMALGLGLVALGYRRRRR